MATEIKEIRIAVTASTAAADAQTLANGRPVFDGVQLRVHDGATPGGKKCAMQGSDYAVVAYFNSTVTGTGTTAVSIAPAQALATGIINVTAGSGAYTHNVTLPLVNTGAVPFTAGSTCRLIIIFAYPVTGYNVDIFSQTTANPKIMRASSVDGVASSCECTFVFTGTAWVAGVLSQQA